MSSIEFDPVEVTLAAGETKTVTMWGRGTCPETWWPTAPRLYTLKVGARTLWQAETMETKFGFREITAEGDHLLLNGLPIQLLTVTFPRLPYDLDPTTILAAAKLAGANAVWLQGQPWPEAWYDAADETGLLVIADSGLAGPASQYEVGPELWGAARDHVERMTRTLANHPSIVVWNVETELMASGQGTVPLMPVNGLRELAHSLDGARPILAAGEGDLGDTANSIIGALPLSGALFSKAWPEAAFCWDAPLPSDAAAGATWDWKHDKPVRDEPRSRIPRPRTCAWLPCCMATAPTRK